jgi:hypothetical protein
MRLRTSATGRVTDEEMYKASMRQAEERIGNVKDHLEKRLQDELPDRQRAILQQMLMHIEEFEPIRKRLAESPTQEGIDEVMAIHRRQHEEKMALLESFRPGLSR